MGLIEHDKIKYMKEGWQRELNIISAGPSLKRIDLKSFKGKAVMTLNNSIFHIPNTIRPLYHVYCETLEQEKDNYITMSQLTSAKLFTMRDYPGWYTVPPFENIENYAFQVAIMLGIEMDYKIINLYGYDFSMEGGYKYWWSETQDADTDKEHILTKQKDIFNKFIQKIQKEYKIKVNIGSKADLISIEEYLNE